jgi:predicted TIM-barrel fold metal-dependent hydrolase
MTDNGIVRGLLLSPPLTSGAPLPNEQVLDLCRRSQGLLLPVLTVVPTDAGVREAVSLARKNRESVKGFKVLLGYFEVFASSPVFNGLYEYAEKEGLPVMFHGGHCKQQW